MAVVAVTLEPKLEIQAFKTLSNDRLQYSRIPRAFALAATSGAVLAKAAPDSTAVVFELELPNNYAYEMTHASFSNVNSTGDNDFSAVGNMQIKMPVINATPTVSEPQHVWIPLVSPGVFNWVTGMAQGQSWVMQSMPNFPLRAPPGDSVTIKASFADVSADISGACTFACFMLFNVYDLSQDNAYPLHETVRTLPS